MHVCSPNRGLCMHILKNHKQENHKVPFFMWGLILLNVFFSESQTRKMKMLTEMTTVQQTLQRNPSILHKWTSINRRAENILTRTDTMVIPVILQVMIQTEMDKTVLIIPAMPKDPDISDTKIIEHLTGTGLNCHSIDLSTQRITYLINQSGKINNHFSSLNSMAGTNLNNQSGIIRTQAVTSQEEVSLVVAVISHHLVVIIQTSVIAIQTLVHIIIIQVMIVIHQDQEVVGIIITVTSLDMLATNLTVTGHMMYTMVVSQRIKIVQIHPSKLDFLKKQNIPFHPDY